MTAAKPCVALWLGDTGPNEEALKQAKLAERIELHTCKLNQEPPADVLARCEAMLALRAAPGVLTRAPKLRFIQAFTAGVEGWLALPDLSPQIALAGARGTHRIAMPENILGTLFHLTKPYAAAALDQRERKWTRRQSIPLADKTLGILGVGAIGEDLARRTAALDMTVIGTRRTPDPVPHVDRMYGPGDADRVLADSDFVVLLLPLTPDTRGYMNTARLKQMKPSAYLLNFGRGELVVDAELIEAVKAKTIAGAVLDVFATEPLPAEHPFWGTEGISVLPHIGGGHPTRDRVVAELFTDNLTRFLDGRPLVHLVDRARGY
jgi:phosphoglycerate dehydrogenase-like enzyme